MNEIPVFAPGCFGSALAFQADNIVCKGCAMRDRCQPVHEENLAKLRAHLCIKPQAPKLVKKEAPAAPAVDPAPALTMSAPAKVLIDKLDGSKFKITEKLNRGENPFENSNLRFMHVACDLLLKLRARALGQPLLVTALITKLGVTQAAANTYARLAFQALTHIGAVDDIDGTIKLRAPVMA